MKTFSQHNSLGRILFTIVIIVIIAASVTHGQTIINKGSGDNLIESVTTLDTSAQFIPGSAENEVPRLQDGFGALVFKTFITLITIIALIWAAVWALKKFVFARRENNAVSMRLVSTLVLGPKRNLSLVEIHGRFLVLGVTENSINMLAELNDVDLSKSHRSGGSAGREQLSAGAFGEMLNSFLRKNKNASEKNES